MHWKIKMLFFVAVFLWSCKSDRRLEHEINDFNDTINYLLELEDVDELKEHEHIKFIDFRKPEAYAKGHISNAINIWRTSIEDTRYPYKGMMASKAKMELLFSNLGIKNTDTLIVYDDNGLCDSARLWWVALNYGFNNIRLLNGGLDAWSKSGRPLTTHVEKNSKSKFKFPEQSPMQYYASKDDVLKALRKGQPILDTRTFDEYTGKRQKKKAFKGGRISSSIMMDWALAVDYNGDKKIKSKDTLMTIYNALNISKEDTLIVYCHSGVRSAHTCFVLTQLLGYKNVKNYDGSWIEWSYFDELPFEQDSTTVIIK